MTTSELQTALINISDAKDIRIDSVVLEYNRLKNWGLDDSKIVEILRLTPVTTPQHVS